MEAQAKADSNDEGKQVVIVSSDAVTTSQAVQVEPAKPFVVQEVITESERVHTVAVPVISFPVSVVTTLLKSVLSPQAP